MSTFLGGSGNNTCDGTVGFDTVDYGAFAEPITLTTVNPGGGGWAFNVSKVAPNAGTDQLRNIERVIGGAGNDSFTGLSPFTPGPILTWVGGPGNDTFNALNNPAFLVSYADATSGVTLVLPNAPGAAGSASGGGRGNDVLLAVTRVQGSAFNDTVTGSHLADWFSASAGSDTITGGDGRDWLDLGFFGGNWAVTLSTGAPGGWGGTAAKAGGGIDTFGQIEGIQASRSNTNDSFASTVAEATGQALLVLRGNQGNDSYSLAGNRNVVVSYATWNSTSGIIFDLAAGTATGTGKADTLSGVRAFIGTSRGDIVTGSAAAEVFYGTTGNADTYTGGGGADVLSYSGPDATVQSGITLTLTGPSGGGFANRGGGAVDTFAGMLGGVVGGNGSDLFAVITQAANTLDGGGGSNTLGYTGLAGGGITATAGPTSSCSTPTGGWPRG